MLAGDLSKTSCRAAHERHITQWQVRVSSSHVPRRLPQDPTETDTWEECFAKNVKIMFDHELIAQGPDDDIAQLRDKIMGKVIPRLLRPLEVGGRKVVPRLVHGDLWEGNAGTDVRTGLPKIFDACSLYAHNECDLSRPRSAYSVRLLTSSIR